MVAVIVNSGHGTCSSASAGVIITFSHRAGAAVDGVSAA